MKRNLIVICIFLLNAFIGFNQIQIGGSQPKKQQKAKSEKPHKQLLNDSIDNKMKLFLGATYASTFRSLEPNKNSLFADSLGERAKELSKGNWGIHLGFNSEISKYFMWEAGVSFFMNGERYHFSDVDTTHKYVNKYSWIGVPLKVHFKYDINRFRFSVGGGIIPQMQLKYRQKDDFSSRDGGSKTISTKTIEGMNTFGISGIVNAGVHFNISKRVGIYALFEYRHQLTNSFLKTKPYNHKGTSTGVNFGITFGI